MFDTLRTRLAAIVGCCTLLVGGLVAATGFVILRSELRETALTDLAQSSSHYAAEAQRALDTLRQGATILGLAPEVRAALHDAAPPETRPGAPDSPPEGGAGSGRASGSGTVVPPGAAAPALAELFTDFIAEHAGVSQVRLVAKGLPGRDLARVERRGAEIVEITADGLRTGAPGDVEPAARRLRPDGTALVETGGVPPTGDASAPVPPVFHKVQAVPIGAERVAGYLVVSADAAQLFDAAFQPALGTRRVTIWTPGGALLHLAPGDAPRTTHRPRAADPLPPPGLATTDREVSHVARFTALDGRDFAVAATVPRALYHAQTSSGLLPLVALAIGLSGATALAALAAAGPLARPLDRLTAAVAHPRDRFAALALPEGGYREVRRLASAIRKAAEALVVEARDVEWRAVHDGLSGLRNRRGFEDILAARASRGGEVTLIQLDLDRFKLVNDTLGHEAGDAVIAAVGRRLTALLGPDGVAGRMGGDEFVLLREGGSAREVAAFAEAAIPALSAPLRHHGRICRFGVSMGAAIGPAADLADDGLMKRADLALYKAKRDGRGRYQLFDRSMDRRLRDRGEILGSLEDAMASGAIGVVYRPRVGVQGGALVGLEALARWQRADGTVVPRAAFLPLAEETGRLDALERLVLDRVAEDVTGLRAAGAAPPTISVNASARSLRNPDLVARIRDYGLPARALSFDLQESALLAADEADMRWTIDALREMGAGIAIDNFGSGQASILSIAKIEPDWLNVDHALISAVASETSVKLLVKAIVDMAIPLGTSVHAVGVETGAQAEALRQIDCATMQGDLFGAPVDRSGVARLLRDGAEPVAPRRSDSA